MLPYGKHQYTTKVPKFNVCHAGLLNRLAANSHILCELFSVYGGKDGLEGILRRNCVKQLNTLLSNVTKFRERAGKTIITLSGKKRRNIEVHQLVQKLNNMAICIFICCC